MILVCAALADDAEFVFRDACANAFGCDDALGEVGVEQERGKFISAKTGCSVAAAQVSGYGKTDLLDGLAAGEVAKLVVHTLKIISVHHQHTEGTSFRFC